MVEAESHLKLLPASMLDICTVFEHIYMLSIGMVAALHSYPLNLASIWGFWVTYVELK